MNVLDEDGNLFGVVNVVDALVVLFVVAVVIAGVALAFGSGDSPAGGGPDEEAAVRYATLDLGTQPWYVANRIDEGDVTAPSDSSNATVTDVYASPSGDGDTRLYARVAVGGVVSANPETGESVFRHEGEPLQIGQEFPLETRDYAVTGRMTSLERSGSALPTESTPVVVETDLAAATARQVESGDVYRIGEYPVATVESVTAYPSGDDRRRVVAGLNLTTIRWDDSPTFAASPVGIGSSVPVRAADYEFTGNVIRRGTAEQAGEGTTATATLRLAGVGQARASGIREGMTETIDGRTLATIEDVTTEPSQVVTRTDDGEVLLRDHPRNRDVTIEASLRVRRTDGRIRFHGMPLRVGDTVSLDLGVRTLQAEVVDLR